MPTKKRSKKGSKAPPNVRETKKKMIADDVVNEKKKEIIHGIMAPEKEEQPFLFGEADMILNTLETEKTEIESQIKLCLKSIDRLENKIGDLNVRHTHLSDAAEAARKHAPMKEEPAPPSEEPRRQKELEHVEKLEQLAKEEEKRKEEDEQKQTTEDDSKIEAPGLKTPDPDEHFGSNIEVGDTVKTNYNTGPFIVEEISGPYDKITFPGTLALVDSPPHYSLKMSEPDAKRNKDGSLPKNYQYSYINDLIIKDGKIVNIFADNTDEVTIIAKPIKTNPLLPDLPSTASKDPY